MTLFKLIELREKYLDAEESVRNIVQTNVSERNRPHEESVLQVTYDPACHRRDKLLLEYEAALREFTEGK